MNWGRRQKQWGRWHRGVETRGVQIWQSLRWLIRPPSPASDSDSMEA